MPGKQFPLSVKIEAIDKLTAPLQRINAQLNKTFAPMRMLGLGLKAISDESGVSRLGQSIVNLGGSLRAAGREARNLGLTLGAAGVGAAWLFNREFIGTASTFERMQLSLEAIEGSAAKAGQSMAFLKKMTVDTPFEMEELAKSFRIMRGFGLDPTNGALKSIVDQVAKLGGTGEDLTGIAMQLGQAFSKGRLQAQDANILVERGVPVWGLLQRAAERFGKKIPIKELRKMSEGGQLGQKAVLQLIQQMGIESKGASERMMKSWSGMVSNLSDQWTFFKLAVMKSGPFDWLKGKLQGVLDLLGKMQKSGELDVWAERVGGKIVGVLEQLWSFGRDAWEILQRVGSGLKWAHDVFGSWKPLIIGVGLVLAGPLLASVVTVAGAVIGVVAALGSIAGVVGVGVAAVAGLAMAFNPVMNVLYHIGKLIHDYIVAPLGWVGAKLGGAFSGSVPGAGVGGAMGAPAASGAAAGASGIAVNQNITRTNNAAVRVSFDNMPQGARVRPVSGTAPLTLDMGRMMN